jgi:deoxycytidine triphosphate deaminase
MTIMSDKELIHVCGDTAPEPMIKPFLQRQVRYHDECGEATSPLPEGRVDPLWTAKKVISYGLSSYGYDVRLADEFKIFTNVNSVGVDPLNISEDCFVSRKGPYCWIPPNSYILGHTIEYLDMPMRALAPL